MPANIHNPSCTACGHAKDNIFCGLTVEHLGALCKNKTVRRYARGQLIFVHGDPAKTLYCIQSGIVELYKISSREEEIVIRLLRAGDVVGYRPMFTDERMAASARAVEDSVVCLITKSAILSGMRHSPDLALKLLGKLASELKVSEDEMVARVSQTAPERVARFLLWLTSNSGGKTYGPIDFTVPLRRVQMANVIGIAPETLSRILRSFERHEIVRLERRAIRVRDIERLRNLAVGDRTHPN